MAEAATSLERFTAAMYPDRHRVLGRMLRPLALGHLLVLCRLSHPLLIGKGSYDAAAVALGVLVCTRRGDKVAAAVDGIWCRLLILWLGILAWCMPSAGAAFARYLVTGTKGPRTWSEASKESGGFPLWASVLICLQRELNMSEAEALRTPAADALWRCTAVWQASGALEMETDAEREILEEIRNAR